MIYGPIFVYTLSTEIYCILTIEQLLVYVLIIQYCK